MKILILLNLFALSAYAQFIVNPKDRVVYAEKINGCFGSAAKVSDSARSPLYFSSSLKSNTPNFIADNIRDEKTNAKRILMYVQKKSLPADGNSVMGIGLEILDATGKRVNHDTTITLETDNVEMHQGLRFLVQDMDASLVGTQIIIKKGEGCFGIVSPMEPHRGSIIRATIADKVSYSDNSVSVEGSVDFFGEDRPMILVGILEGGVMLKNVSSKNVTPVEGKDPFEQELRLFGQGRLGNEKITFGRRGAAFLKGKIKGDLLLTAAYDSDQPMHGLLFRDIDPNLYYPIYGDASIKGFDAQTSSRLYVKIEKENSYAMFGDYTSASSFNNIDLGRYSRTMIGGKTHLEAFDGKFAVEGFVSKVNQKQFIDELKSNGTSGPFTLTNGNGRVYSEKIEVITRSRAQPGLILSTIGMIRYTDYEFEPFSGRILFKKPIPTFDANLNPIYIRVTYEVENSTKSDWVAGVSTELSLLSSLKIGGSYSKDFNDAQVAGNSRLLELKSAHVVFEPVNALKFIVEGAETKAMTNSLSTISGSALRVNASYLGSQRFNFNLKYGYAQKDFTNPVSQIAPGRQELLGEANVKVTDSTNVKIEGLYSKDVVTSAHRDSQGVSVEQRLGNRFSLQAGIRRTKEVGAATAQSAGIGQISQLDQANNISGGTGPLFSGAGSLGVNHDLLSLKGRLNYALTDRSNTYAEIEQEVRDNKKQMVGVGADYFFSDRSRIYGRHEFLNSLSGVYGLSAGQLSRSSVIGIDTQVTKNTSVYNEYRLRDAQSAREALASFGLRNEFEITDNWRFGVNAERLQALGGITKDHATTLALSLDNVGSELWKTSLRLEGRRSNTNESILSTIGVSRKLNRDWSFLVRNYFLQNDARNAYSEQLQDRFQVGFAYRDVDTNRWHLLSRYELKVEEEKSSSSYLDRLVHIVSAHVNYQKSKPLIYSGQIAAKLVNENFGGGVKDDFSAYLLSGRIMYDLNDRWDISPMASALYSPDDADSMKYALGLELGYLVRQNMWMSVGYNFSGFYDRDLSGLDYTQQGIFLRLRLKFDEDGF